MTSVPEQTKPIPAGARRTPPWWRPRTVRVPPMLDTIADIWSDADPELVDTPAPVPTACQPPCCAAGSPAISATKASGWSRPARAAPWSASMAFRRGQQPIESPDSAGRRRWLNITGRATARQDASWTVGSAKITCSSVPERVMLDRLRHDAGCDPHGRAQMLSSTLTSRSHRPTDPVRDVRTIARLRSTRLEPG